MPCEDEWNRETNFLVKRPKEVSYLVFSNGDLAVTEKAIVLVNFTSEFEIGKFFLKEKLTFLWTRR